MTATNYCYVHIQVSLEVWAIKVTNDVSMPISRCELSQLAITLSRVVLQLRGQLRLHYARYRFSFELPWCRWSFLIRFICKSISINIILDKMKRASFRSENKVPPWLRVKGDVSPWRWLLHFSLIEHFYCSFFHTTSNIQLF